MATRTIENKRDRIATILIAPFMTCSARLPVYTLLIAAFIPEHAPARPLHQRAQVAALLGLYVLGFLAAVVTARAAEIVGSEERADARSCWRCRRYRWPTVQSLGLRLLDRAKVFLRRAGTVILLVTVILWMLAHLPYSGRQAAGDREQPGGDDRAHDRAGDQAAGIQLEDRHRTDHVAGGARDDHRRPWGRFTAWTRSRRRMDLQKALRSDLTPGGAVALLIFFAFAMQCMSTIAVVRRETGGWKWPILQFTYMGVLAYAGALHRLIQLNPLTLL